MNKQEFETWFFEAYNGPATQGFARLRDAIWPLMSTYALSIVEQSVGSPISDENHILYRDHIANMEYGEIWNACREQTLENAKKLISHDLTL